ncbi:MAG: hypothetical protein E3J35_05755 [Methanomassiliicoccales archaeon]|nr:MAG: hypothetical protein E3J35_05755 [Methanomassiliicoccales archaeon]
MEDISMEEQIAVAVYSMMIVVVVFLGGFVLNIIVSRVADAWRFIAFLEGLMECGVISEKKVEGLFREWGDIRVVNRLMENNLKVHFIKTILSWLGFLLAGLIVMLGTLWFVGGEGWDDMQTLVGMWLMFFYCLGVLLYGLYRFLDVGKDIVRFEQRLSVYLKKDGVW